VKDGVQLLGLLLVLLESGTRVSFDEPQSGVTGVGDLLPVLVGELVFELGVVELLLGLVADLLQVVLLSDSLLEDIILGLVDLGLFDHRLDLVLRKSVRVVLDLDRLGDTFGFLTGCDLQETVGVNLIGDFDLWDTSRGRWDTVEMELTKLVVIFRHGSLSLKYFDENTGLVVLEGSEYLGLFCRDGCLPWDKGGHDLSRRLNSKRKRNGVNNQKVLHLLSAGSTKNSGLDASSKGDGFIRIDPPVGLFTIEEVFDETLDLGDTG